MTQPTITNPALAFGGGTDGYWNDKFPLKATEAIARGQLVWLDLASGAPQACLYANAEADKTLLGVADAAAAANEILHIIRAGYCGYIVTDGNATTTTSAVVVSGSGSENTAVAGNSGDISATVIQWTVGKFLAADSGTVGTAWIDIHRIPTGTP